MIPPSEGGYIPISEIAVNDVLCGRGTKHCNQAGNLMYHSLVRSFIADYAKAKKKNDKTEISKAIVDAIRNATPKGRFLSKTKDGFLHEIGDKKAWEKTSQLLRETVMMGNHRTMYQKRKWDKQMKEKQISKKDVKGPPGAPSPTSVQEFYSSAVNSTSNQTATGDVFYNCGVPLSVPPGNISNFERHSGTPTTAKSSMIYGHNIHSSLPPEIHLHAPPAVSTSQETAFRQGPSPSLVPTWMLPAPPPAAALMPLRGNNHMGPHFMARPRGMASTSHLPITTETPRAATFTYSMPLSSQRQAGDRLVKEPGSTQKESPQNSSSIGTSSYVNRLRTELSSWPVQPSAATIAELEVIARYQDAANAYNSLQETKKVQNL